MTIVLHSAPAAPFWTSSKARCLPLWWTGAALSRPRHPGLPESFAGRLKYLLSIAWLLIVPLLGRSSAEYHVGHAIRASVSRSGTVKLGTASEWRVSASPVSAVNPYTGDTKLIGWSDVVVQTLRDVQPSILFNCHPRTGDVEVAQIGLVAPGLLSGHDGIEGRRSAPQPFWRTGRRRRWRSPRACSVPSMCSARP